MVAWAVVEHDRVISTGELVIFADGEAPITFVAGPDGATFVLGSAIPHDHDLHLGYYSVHTTADALFRGEARIAEHGRRVREEGDRRTETGNVPVYR